MFRKNILTRKEGAELHRLIDDLDQSSAASRLEAKSRLLNFLGDYIEAPLPGYILACARNYHEIQDGEEAEIFSDRMTEAFGGRDWRDAIEATTAELPPCSD